MHFTAIVSSIDIRNAFDTLRATLQRGASAHRRYLGWQGGGGHHLLHWHPIQHIWSMCDEGVELNRYWTCYGTVNPALGTDLRAIAVEINIPHEGIDRRTAGVFALGSDGRVYLAHSGKIGGGRPGIGKAAFLQRYRGDLSLVHWEDGKSTDHIIIGRIDSTRLSTQIAAFVLEVERIKALLAGDGDGARNRPGTPRPFTPEFEGRRRYSIGQVIEAQCNHAPVVNALSRALEEHGLDTFNDRRDLYTVDHAGAARLLFEVKTDTTTTSIHTGVGQLLIYGAMDATQPTMYLVLPSRPTPNTRLALESLGIGVIVYRFARAGIEFEGLTQAVR